MIIIIIGIIIITFSRFQNYVNGEGSSHMDSEFCPRTGLTTTSPGSLAALEFTDGDNRSGRLKPELVVGEGMVMREWVAWPLATGALHVHQQRSGSATAKEEAQSKW